jgi:hypothetical protein
MTDSLLQLIVESGHLYSPGRGSVLAETITVLNSHELCRENDCRLPENHKALHEICLNDKLNFGKYKEIAENVSIDFSVDGVKGHRQFVFTDGKDSFYGDDYPLYDYSAAEKKL